MKLNISHNFLFYFFLSILTFAVFSYSSNYSPNFNNFLNINFNNIYKNNIGRLLLILIISCFSMNYFNKSYFIFSILLFILFFELANNYMLSYSLSNENFQNNYKSVFDRQFDVFKYDINYDNSTPVFKAFSK